MRLNQIQELISEHQRKLRRCAKCPNMAGPVVTGNPVASPILLVGQAPGAKEGDIGKPFAWTAGKTLFGWFARIGLDEKQFRERVYIAAVCRCFPGKNPKGGDRVPSNDEITNCSSWLDAEIQFLRPQLVLPVGKLAIAQMMPVAKLADVIGRAHQVNLHEHRMDMIPLPHPSGASTWHRTEPGVTLLEQALRLIRSHHAWKLISEP